jgi:hypothetical protein
MRRQTITPGPTPTSELRLRIIVEDPRLVEPALHTSTGAVEVAVCAGPCDGEVCPMVMMGSCPLGPCDAVVTALDGPWARSVRAAWRSTGTPVVDACELATTDPGERLRHHVGAALKALWAPLVAQGPGPV